MKKIATITEKIPQAFDLLKGTFGYTNIMQAPKVIKVVVSATTGSMKDPKKKTLVGDRLAKITGQKPAAKAAKKSNASFKVRQGDHVGYQITLRGARMNAFLDKIVSVVLPRTRDFRGLDVKGIDSMGNYTFGIKEHTVFPETADEELKDVFGLAVTVVTNSDNKEETKALLEHLGFLFKK